MMPVTKTFLPPIEDYKSYLDGIWQRYWLTNNGPLVNELELKLKEYLNVSNILFVSNGTTALQIAIKALELKGEVITTPFSFVATTSSIAWEGCKPVMVDIDPYTFNIDPTKIEASITSETTAIIATHVFGNPCDIEAIDSIALKHNLRVIYDAAHCFGTTYKDKSIFSYGDVSITSFHASKVFHTIEGGAIFSNTNALYEKMAYMRNFGFSGPEQITYLGINGKNSEFHAAMGLANLKYIDAILAKRKEDFHQYNLKLKSFEFEQQKVANYSGYNFSYYPVLLESEHQLKEIEQRLNKYWIFPKRYFHPSLSSLSYINQDGCNNSVDISSRVLCLPTYYQLSSEEQNMIVRLLLQ